MVYIFYFLPCYAVSELADASNVNVVAVKSANVIVYVKLFPVDNIVSTPLTNLEKLVDATIPSALALYIIWEPS